MAGLRAWELRASERQASRSRGLRKGKGLGLLCFCSVVLRRLGVRVLGVNGFWLKGLGLRASGMTVSVWGYGLQCRVSNVG